MIEFDCSCGTRLRVRDEAAGKTTSCPKCGARLKVPAGEYREGAPRARRFENADDDRARPVQRRPAPHDDYDTYDAPRRREPGGRNEPGGGSALGIVSMCLGLASVVAAGVLCIPVVGRALGVFRYIIPAALALPALVLALFGLRGTRGRALAITGLSAAGLGLLLLLPMLLLSGGNNRDLIVGRWQAIGKKGPVPNAFVEFMSDGRVMMGFAQLKYHFVDEKTIAIEPPAGPKEISTIVNLTDDKLVLETKGQVVEFARVGGSGVAGGGAGGGGDLAGGVQKVREAAARTQSQNNLKNIALGMMHYADVNRGKLPPAVVYDANGRPLYSWRVLILPYLEHANLYDAFKLDEPWDSQHNIKLSSTPVPFYSAPGAAPSDRTHYQVFYSTENVNPAEAAPFLADPVSPKKLQIIDFSVRGFALKAPVQTRFPAGFPDGTSNTILVAEAAESVPWAKPADLEYKARAPLPRLGFLPGGYNVAMADGSTRFIRHGQLGEQTLRNAIMPADGNVLGPDWE